MFTGICPRRKSKWNYNNEIYSSLRKKVQNRELIWVTERGDIFWKIAPSPLPPLQNCEYYLRFWENEVMRFWWEKATSWLDISVHFFRSQRVTLFLKGCRRIRWTKCSRNQKSNQRSKAIQKKRSEPTFRHVYEFYSKNQENTLTCIFVERNYVKHH